MANVMTLSWGLLAVVHLAPALVFARPGLVERLYEVSPTGDVGVLLVHRGALFASLVMIATVAAFDPGARRAAALALATSVVGFLVVYLRAGSPEGALRTIAIVDAGALVPLAIVLYGAFGGVR